MPDTLTAAIKAGATIHVQHDPEAYGSIVAVITVPGEPDRTGVAFDYPNAIRNAWNARSSA